MQSTLTAKPSDDPHDVVVVASDAVRVAPSDDELSDLLQQAAHFRSDAPAREASDVAAAPMVPPVDTTFRAASVNDGLVAGERRSMARRARRGLITLLLTGCIGLAAVGWKAYGDVAARQIAKLTTLVVLGSSLTSERSAPAAQPAPPAAEADVVNAPSPQPAPLAQVAAPAAAPAAAASADQAQSLQSMARDLASVTQQVEQLKASIAELRASQQQKPRDVAKPSEVGASEVRASEPNLRPRLSVPPPRPAVARMRKPTPSYPPPQALAAPVLPQAVPVYVPQPQPQIATEPVQVDPELSSVPRPPMPLR